MTGERSFDGTLVAALLAGVSFFPAYPSFAKGQSDVTKDFPTTSGGDAKNSHDISIPGKPDNGTTRGSGRSVPLETISPRGTRTGNGYGGTTTGNDGMAVPEKDDNGKTTGNGSHVPLETSSQCGTHTGNRVLTRMLAGNHRHIEPGETADDGGLTKSLGVASRNPDMLLPLRDRQGLPRGSGHFMLFNGFVFRSDQPGSAWNSRAESSIE